MRIKFRLVGVHLHSRGGILSCSLSPFSWVGRECRNVLLACDMGGV